MKVLIYLPEEKLAPAGGPLAVGYYYHQEIEKNKDVEVEFITAKEAHVNAVAKNVVSHLPSWINQIHRSIRKVAFINNYFKHSKDDGIDYNQYDAIHFHQTGDMYEVRNKLAEYKGLVILQSHSPMPWYQEQMEKVPSWARFVIKDYKKKFEDIDRYAFERADYLVFPCKEAEEPYEICWPYFNDFKRCNSHKFKYVLTGINSSYAKQDRQTILDKYCIPSNSFVISYIGRHNKVKGFDILKDICSIYFEKNHNAYVISAGKEAPISRLDHERWKEIGFTKDPHSIISASDVFILPNRMTYFDIVMIEILSLGKIVIASRTGGNRYFEGKAEGVLLYNTIDEAAKLLEKVNMMSVEERNKLEASNKLFFENYLTSKEMYRSYKTLLANIFMRQ